jgi:protein CpxP
MMRRPGRGPNGGRAAGVLGRGRFLNDPAIRERLGITADQTAKIRQQDSNFEKARIREQADLQVRRIELRELLGAENPDRKAIDGKLQQVSAAQMALEKSAIDHGLAVRDILTPEQRQQLEQMRANRVRPGGAQAGPQRPAGTPPRARRGAAPPAPNPQR